MKCKQVRELMGAYVYGDLAAHELKDVRLHAQDCAECREDLRTRGLVIDAIPSTAPALSDEDRQRMVWSVKGAIRAKEREDRSVFWRVAPAFGLAAALALGLGIGALISANHTKPPPTGGHSVVQGKPRHSEPGPTIAVSPAVTPDTPDTTAANPPEAIEKPASTWSPLPLPFGVLSSRGAGWRNQFAPPDSPLPTLESDTTENQPEPETSWMPLPKPVVVEDETMIPEQPTE